MSAALFKKKVSHRDAQVLLVTLRSGSISFAVLVLTTQKPIIAYEKTVPIAIKEGGNASDFICQTEAALAQKLEIFITEAISHFSKHNLGKLTLREASVMSTAPWYSFVTKDLVIEKEKPFVLTEKKFESLVAAQVNAHHKKPHDLVEQHITHVILNGYELTNPFKKETKQLAISLYISFFEKKCRSMIVDSITDRVGVKNIQFRTQPLVSFLALRDALYTHHSYAHVYMSSENTEITVVKQGAIAHVIQIPKGKRWIVEEYSKVKGCTIDIAISNISRFDEKTFNEHDPDYDIMTTIKKKWITEVVDVATSEAIQIPNYLYVSGNPVVQKIIVHACKSDDFIQKLYSNEARVVVTPLTVSQFSAHVAWDHTQTPIAYTDVILHAHFIAMQHAL